MANFKSNKGDRTKKAKPKFTKIKVEIADSDFYNNNLDSLYNLLCSISFDKVAIPVSMSKAELFDNDQLKGFTQFGTIIKFNTDNTFTVSVQESYAGKFNADKHVMGIRCHKDFETGEITYVNSFSIVKGKSVQNGYADLEKVMLASESEEDYPKAEVTE